MRKLEKFDQAILACKQVVELKPDFSNALINLGQLLSDQERYEEALIYLEKALKNIINPLKLIAFITFWKFG